MWRSRLGIRSEFSPSDAFEICLDALGLSNTHCIETSAFSPILLKGGEARASEQLGALHLTYPFEIAVPKTSIRQVRLCRHGGDFDPAQPSDFDHLVNEAELDTPEIGNFGQQIVEWLIHMRPSFATTKNTYGQPKAYVLVIDQPQEDVKSAKTDQSGFDAMISAAEEHFPAAKIVVLRPFAGTGHIQERHYQERVQFARPQDDPWDWLDYALGVFTHSSDWGFLSMVAGHRPWVYGTPFYAGRGLSTDINALSFRSRKLSLAQLATLYIGEYCQWVDLDQKEIVDFSHAMFQLQADQRSWKEDHQGWHAQGVALWKRPHFEQFFGQHHPVKFDQSGPYQFGWGPQKSPQTHAVEDGFLRSRGLGASLVPPLSLVLDQRGIYYDPQNHSDLEYWIDRSVHLPKVAQIRAQMLIDKILTSGLSKYNLPMAANPFEGGYHLVLGQVEDDASIRLGGDQITGNDALLSAVRERVGNETIIYKPHPDIEAKLRDGALKHPQNADHIATNTNVIRLIEKAKAVHTMTSLGGFEALLRGKTVHTYGMPFYAGWGLTIDHAVKPDRRTAQPTLWQLAHAVLIDYPRYFDPVHMRPTSPETVVARLNEPSWQNQPRHLLWAARAQRLLRKIPYGSGLWRWRRQ